MATKKPKKRKSPVSAYLSKIGRKGGAAKVPKGVATLTPEERKERASAAAKARWSPKASKEK